MSSTQPPDVSIPILGRPLSGKSTFLINVARQFDAEIAGWECPVMLGKHDLSTQIEGCQLSVSGQSVELWCMPGGCAPEWQVNVAKGASSAILVAEPQPTTFDHQAEYFDAFEQALSVRWFTVVGKQDLTHLIVPPDDFLPAFAASTPRLVYSALADDAPRLAAEYLTSEVIPKVSSTAYCLEARIAAIREEFGTE